MRWLSETPQAVVQAHLAMLPRLRAREAINAVNQAAVAAGTLKPTDQKSMLRRWDAQASGETAKPRVMTAIDLMSMGLAIELDGKPVTG